MVLEAADLLGVNQGLKKKKASAKILQVDEHFL